MGELPLLVAVFLTVALVCVVAEDDVTPRLSFLYGKWGQPSPLPRRLRSVVWLLLASV